MITGSHNPSEYNGFKLCDGHEALHGPEIQRIAQVIEARRFHSGQGSTTTRDALSDYREMLVSKFQLARPLKVVADWGQSIESTDRYTYGHCGRVADYGIKVAQAMGLNEDEQTTLRLGAYLHDVGKVKVPHEVLNKPGRLTEEEFEIVKHHPVWGLELLAAVEFPWDIKPIIRWHHERYDGTGYPDRLKGDEIPLNAQIICIVDVYDALTTTRSYRAALPREEALPIMEKSRHWWRDDVYQAFMRSVAVE